MRARRARCVALDPDRQGVAGRAVPAPRIVNVSVSIVKRRSGEVGSGSMARPRPSSSTTTAYDAPGSDRSCRRSRSCRASASGALGDDVRQREPRRRPGRGRRPAVSRSPGLPTARRMSCSCTQMSTSRLRSRVCPVPFDPAGRDRRSALGSSSGSAASSVVAPFDRVLELLDHRSLRGRASGHDARARCRSPRRPLMCGAGLSIVTRSGSSPASSHSMRRHAPRRPDAPAGQSVGGATPSVDAARVPRGRRRRCARCRRVGANRSPCNPSQRATGLVVVGRTV